MPRLSATPHVNTAATLPWENEPHTNNASTPRDATIASLRAPKHFGPGNVRRLRGGVYPEEIHVGEGICVCWGKVAQGTGHLSRGFNGSFVSE